MALSGIDALRDHKCRQRQLQTVTLLRADLFRFRKRSVVLRNFVEVLESQRAHKIVFHGDFSFGVFSVRLVVAAHVCGHGRPDRPLFDRRQELPVFHGAVVVVVEVEARGVTEGAGELRVAGQSLIKCNQPTPCTRMRPQGVDFRSRRIGVRALQTFGKF